MTGRTFRAGLPRRVALLFVAALSLTAACGTTKPTAVVSAQTSTAAASPQPATPVRSHPVATSRPATPSTPPRSSHSVEHSANGPVIVVDPGHSPLIYAIDPATGLNVSDYENEPEMRDVFAVAELVKAKLLAAGYRVIMTKDSATDRVSLAQRAAIANNAHAALALSIHDQAGANGGIGFDSGNNTVYYQSVGNYRETPNGTRIVFSDSRVAALSMRCGQTFQAQREKVEGHQVALLGNTGYDLGSRGLAAGNIWLVQLLSHVPWIYNEAGGNSAGTTGLSATDERRYADGLVAGVEHCIPPTR